MEAKQAERDGRGSERIKAEVMATKACTKVRVVKRYERGGVCVEEMREEK